jgi:hypothetical protein
MSQAEMKSTFTPTQPSRFRKTATNQIQQSQQYDGLIQQIEATLGQPLSPQTRERIEVAMHNVLIAGFDFALRTVENSEIATRKLTEMAAQLVEGSYVNGGSNFGENPDNSDGTKTT